MACVLGDIVYILYLLPFVPPVRWVGISHKTVETADWHDHPLPDGSRDLGTAPFGVSDKPFHIKDALITAAARSYWAAYLALPLYTARLSLARAVWPNEVIFMALLSFSAGSLALPRTEYLAVGTTRAHRQVSACNRTIVRRRPFWNLLPASTVGCWLSVRDLHTIPRYAKAPTF